MLSSIEVTVWYKVTHLVKIQPSGKGHRNPGFWARHNPDPNITHIFSKQVHHLWALFLIQFTCHVRNKEIWFTVPFVIKISALLIQHTFLFSDKSLQSFKIGQMCKDNILTQNRFNQKIKAGIQ